MAEARTFSSGGIYHIRTEGIGGKKTDYWVWACSIEEAAKTVADWGQEDCETPVSAKFKGTAMISPRSAEVCHRAVESHLDEEEELAPEPASDLEAAIDGLETVISVLKRFAENGHGS